MYEIQKYLSYLSLIIFVLVILIRIKNKTMIEKFLKAKHWQLFLLIFGIPLICQFIVMGAIISGISSENEFNVELMLNYFKIFPLIMALFMGVFFGWFYSVGVGLDKKIPDELKLKVGRFKIFLLIPVVYMLFFLIFMGTIMNGMIKTGMAPNLDIFGLVFPLHIFSMFCIFYCLYFVAKTIKTAELQREVEFGDFVGEFFLIWFYPIGIWIIQPKINKIIEAY